MMAILYNSVNLLMLIYACYSWYWQAKLELRGKYRLSLLIWTVLIIWVGFYWNMLEQNQPGITMFLALLLLTSIIDGFTGFAQKRVVVSGYFKRTISYQEIEHISLIDFALGEKVRVICIIETNNGRQYTLQFAKQIEKIIHTINEFSDHEIDITVRKPF